MAAGADPTIENSDQETGYDFASRKGRNGHMAVLERYARQSDGGGGLRGATGEFENGFSFEGPDGSPADVEDSYENVG